MRTQFGFMLDDDLYEKLLEIQAKLLKKSIKSVSLNRIVNELLRYNLK